MDGSFRQKLNSEILKLTDLINQMNLIVIYRTFYPNSKEYFYTLNSWNFIQSCPYTQIQNNIQQIEANNSMYSIRPPGIKAEYQQQNNRKPTNSYKLNKFTE